MSVPTTAKSGKDLLKDLITDYKIRYTVIADSCHIDRYKFKAWMFNRPYYNLSNEEIDRILDWLDKFQKEMTRVKLRLGFYNRPN